jgi:flagellar FliJ protein
VADLKTLIRLHKFQLDEKRRALAEIMTVIEGMQKQRQAQEEELATEQRLSGESMEAARAFPAYAKETKHRIELLGQAIAQVRIKEQEMADMVQEAFEELKRIETIQERRLAEEEAEQARAERQELDEIGAIAYDRRRREDSGGA